MCFKTNFLFQMFSDEMHLTDFLLISALFSLLPKRHLTVKELQRCNIILHMIVSAII